MKTNPLQRVHALGQSVWLDILNRDLLSSGMLERLIREDGISGVTSNPKTFSDSVTEGSVYDAEIQSLIDQEKTPRQIYEVLAVRDVRDAADVLRPTHERSAGSDGFVSLEISPQLAYDTSGTIQEAHRLWSAVNRPNVLIKVPATRESLPAISRLLADGINVNITLLFGLERYEEVIEAYISGIRERAAAGKPLAQIMSVASFFLSRIDVLVDSKLEKSQTANTTQKEALRGKVATACAKLAYVRFRAVFQGDAFRSLARHGARAQHLLWASTGAKKPDDSPTKYVEPLIGPNTVTTLPMKTMEAYRNQGTPAARLTENVDEAETVLRTLAGAGIDLAQLAAELEEQGVRKFTEPYDRLMTILEKKGASLHA